MRTVSISYSTGDVLWQSGVLISHCERYRWRLWRVWDRSKPKVIWVMLNPSTADATEDDATIRRCIGFAKLWGYGGIVVVNLFAIRSTDPKTLQEAGDPIGASNVEHINALFGDPEHTSSLVVAAWGNHVPDAHAGHVASIVEMLRPLNAQCLGKTKSGQPRHPVRLAYETALVPL